MNGWGWFFLILLLIVLAYGAWAGWHFYSAKRRGDPPPPIKSYIPFYGSRAQPTTNYPTPRSGGPGDWIKDQFAKLRQGRSSRGAYEDASAQHGGREYSGLGLASGQGHGHGRGRGLEDDAWDARVEAGDEERYGGEHGEGYEEQDYGLAPTPGYAQGNVHGQTDYINQNTSYHGGSAASAAADNNQRGRNLTNDNPFADAHAAPSLRSVSPRPHIDPANAPSRHQTNASLDSTHSSPTSIRKSHFREGI